MFVVVQNADTALTLHGPRMPYFFLAFGLVTFFVQLGLAIAIYDDAAKIKTSQQPLAIGPWLWAWATLVGGVITVGIYWFIYHSKLRSDRSDSIPPLP